jgi:AraC-like DNA-binding protein
MTNLKAQLARSFVPAAEAHKRTNASAKKHAFARASGDRTSGDPAHQDPKLLRRLLRAKDRMDAASHEDWPVRRLARVGGVSEAHFARSFKLVFGVPPHRYLLTRRIERATALLRDTNLSITEIAFRTGWGSLGTFGRTFRDVTGESPGALRMRCRATAHDFARVPACYVSAAHRPDLTIAVSEKRRGVAGGIKRPKKQEVSDESGCPSGRFVRPRSGRSTRVLRRQARVPRPHRRAER